MMKPEEQRERVNTRQGGHSQEKLRQSYTRRKKPNKVKNITTMNGKYIVILAKQTTSGMGHLFAVLSRVSDKFAVLGGASTSFVILKKETELVALP